MNGQWKPGDVAMRKGIGGKGEERTVVTQSPGCRDNHSRDPHWHHAGGGWDPIESHPLSTYRPLVVIDPESRVDIERLRDLYDREVISQNDPDPHDVTPAARGNALQAALREYARPTPPKCGLRLDMSVDYGEQGYSEVLECQLPEDHDSAHKDDRDAKVTTWGPA